MVRLRRGSTDHGRASLLGCPAAVTQRSRSVGGGRSSGALGINAEQLEYLRKLATTTTKTSEVPNGVEKSIYRRGSIPEQEGDHFTSEVENISYKRGSVDNVASIMLNPDTATEVSRRKMSIGYDNGFDEAFEAYKEREKRRKSSMWKPGQERQESSETTRKIIVLTLIVSVPLLIIILLSIYMRTGSK